MSRALRAIFSLSVRLGRVVTFVGLRGPRVALNHGSVLPSVLVGAHFPETQWSIVMRAGTGHRQALQTLCEAYWYPLYAFARRSGCREQDALDLVQEMITDLLARDSLSSADPKRGRFRSYLMGALKNHLAQHLRRQGAQKRGGGVRTISIDSAVAEARYQAIPSHEETPEKLFIRQWAFLMVDRTRAEVALAYEGTRKALYDELACVLLGDTPPGGYAGVGDRVGMSEGAVKVAAHRLKRRFQRELRREVAQTLADSGDIETELRELLQEIG